MPHVKPELPDNSLALQKNPEPPAQPPAPAPSLWLYVVLSISAIVLMVIARLGGESWPNFCLNLGTNIIAAILILIVVEHRLRQDDLRVFRRVPLKTKSIVMALFPDARHVVGYSRILVAQMEKVAKPYLESRRELEEAVTAKLQVGIVLIGEVGSGRTTLIHRVIRKQMDEVLRRPRKARVPVLVTGNRWIEGSAENALLETMRSFYPVSESMFRRLLRAGRLLCIFDSVDEALEPSRRLETIAELQHRYPVNVLVLSARPLPAALSGLLDRLQLERFEVPHLSADERAKLLELKARCLRDN